MSNDERKTPRLPIAAVLNASEDDDQSAERNPTKTSFVPRVHAPQQAFASNATHIDATAIAAEVALNAMVAKSLTDLHANPHLDWFHASQSESKGPEPAGKVGGGPSRKRDHDTMDTGTASSHAKDSAAAIATVTSSHASLHGGNDSSWRSRYRRILPKAPGGTQEEGPGQAQGHGATNDPSHPGRRGPSDGGVTDDAYEFNQEPADVPHLLPPLPPKDFESLPRFYQVASISSRKVAQEMVNALSQMKKSTEDEHDLEFSARLQSRYIEQWETVRRAFIEIAAATCEGREPLGVVHLKNTITEAVGLILPDPDRSLCSIKNMYGASCVPATTRVGLTTVVNNGTRPDWYLQSPTQTYMKSGKGKDLPDGQPMSSEDLEAASVEEMDAKIYLHTIDINERMHNRQLQITYLQKQLHDLVIEHSQAHTQAWQELAAAIDRFHVAGFKEWEKLAQLESKRSERIANNVG